MSCKGGELALLSGILLSRPSIGSADGDSGTARDVLVFENAELTFTYSGRNVFPNFIG